MPRGASTSLSKEGDFWKTVSGNNILQHTIQAKEPSYSCQKISETTPPITSSNQLPRYCAPSSNFNLQSVSIYCTISSCKSHLEIVIIYPLLSGYFLWNVEVVYGSHQLFHVTLRHMHQLGQAIPHSDFCLASWITFQIAKQCSTPLGISGILAF